MIIGINTCLCFSTPPISSAANSLSSSAVKLQLSKLISNRSQQQQQLQQQQQMSQSMGAMHGGTGLEGLLGPQGMGGHHQGSSGSMSDLGFDFNNSNGELPPEVLATCK
jgi:hypothetical protein